jgi:hypothetical protein
VNPVVKPATVPICIPDLHAATPTEREEILAIVEKLKKEKLEKEKLEK